MKRAYKVAGHKFAVVMPDDALAWNEMRKYEPFLVENDDDCIFTVELIEDMPDTSEKQKITTDCAGFEFPRYDIYDWKGQWLFEGAPHFDAPVRFYLIVDKTFKKARFRILGSQKFSLNTVMMLMFTMATQCSNTLMIHSSVTVKDGKGYLFLGRSGTGKSTHSQLWINNIGGCELLNDDNPALRIDENGELRVYGSPWSGKTDCYRNLDFPVGAIVDLHQAKENKIKRLSIVEAYATIYVPCSGLRFVKELVDGLHDTIEKIVSTVSCYSLECLPNAEAAILCYKTVTR